MTTAARHPFVLVADDDRDTRELYRACFDTSGYRTAEANTGSQAIAAAVEIVPDVLLTDYVLPDVDGLTIARRLKHDERTSGIRIVMVTGYATPDLERQAQEAGVDRVFLKPALPQAVMREVSRVLTRGVRAVPVRTAHFAAAGPDASRRIGRDRRDPEGHAGAVARVREEFALLPGLTLTAEQARLIFDLEPAAAQRILDALVAEGFLSRLAHGVYRRDRQTRPMFGGE
jgi:CheY-like chemotaxis protein